MASKEESPFILSIDTAMRAGSVAISKGRSVLAKRAGDPEISHSSDLLQQVRAVLIEAGVALNRIDLFAASVGPGSFTGLRIGLATVKAFAATLARPCLGVPTLQAIAYSAGPSQRTLALLPAGRGEVYAQMFTVDKNWEVNELDEPVHIAPNALLKRVIGFPDLLLAGEGAKLLTDSLMAFLVGQFSGFGQPNGADGAAEMYEEVGEGKHQWLISQNEALVAESVAALASRRFLKNETVSPEMLRAIYVRPSDAELKQKC